MLTNTLYLEYVSYFQLAQTPNQPPHELMAGWKKQLNYMQMNQMTAQ